MGNPGCAHTNPEYEPWWEVDIKRTTAVSQIFIMNRDCCQERLKPFIVYISTDKTSYKACGGLHYFTKGGFVYCAPPIYGRYVRIVRKRGQRSEKDYTTLCEVGVWAATKGEQGILLKNLYLQE